MKFTSIGRAGLTILLGSLATVCGAILLALAKGVRHWSKVHVLAFWHWSGSDAGIPNWLLALLVACSIAGLAFAYQMFVAPLLVTPGEVSMLTRAEEWRDAVVKLTDTFLDRRTLVSGAPPAYDQSWLIEYREQRGLVGDLYYPVAAPFRQWIRLIPEEYLKRRRSEPDAFDFEDGPDETPDGLVEKLWHPVSFPEAIDFWQEWDQADLQKLVADRIALIDDFIRGQRRDAANDAS